MGLLSEGRENARNLVSIGSSFASDWLRGWHEFFRPITAELVQSRVTCDTQLQIALTNIIRD